MIPNTVPLYQPNKPKSRVTLTLCLPKHKVVQTYLEGRFVGNKRVCLNPNRAFYLICASKQDITILNGCLLYLFMLAH